MKLGTLYIAMNTNWLQVLLNQICLTKTDVLGTLYNPMNINRLQRLLNQICLTKII